MKEFYKRLITGTLLGAGTLSLFFLPPLIFVLFVIAIFIRIVLREWPRLFNYKDPAFWLLLPIYLMLPLALICFMHLEGYEVLNILLITLVCAHDSGSYFIGKYWGKHKISPLISPKKTWEGFIGGFFLASSFALLLFGHNGPSIFIMSMIPFVALICFTSLAGDLFESWLKRRAGVKDAGQLLPGHGGMLDRIDGILFVAPLIFLLRNWLQPLLPFS